jgi:hypothetical protein
METTNDRGKELAASERQQKVAPAILGAYYMGFNAGDALNDLTADEREKQSARLDCPEMHQLKNLELKYLGSTGIEFTFTAPDDISSDLVGTFSVGSDTFKAIFPLNGTVYYTVTNGATNETNETADINMFESMVANSSEAKQNTKKNRGRFFGLFK